MAIICADYTVSKLFYTDILGLGVIAEEYRAGRDSWKLNLAIPGGGQIELFSFPASPPRPSYPEACGLRHLAFAVRDVEAFHAYIVSHVLEPEAIRKDDATDRRFFFFQDPDGVPIEIYEG